MTDEKYNELLYLRRHTRLNILQKMKIIDLKCSAIELYEEFNRIEHAQLGVDMTSADEYEYEVRLKKLKLRLCGDFLNLKQRPDFDVYFNDLFQREVQKEIPEIKKRLLK